MGDLVIRGGTVVDGTGRPAFRADVEVRGDRIAAVGDVDAAGAREIDAGGLTITPGFVDLHTHYDGQATWDSELAPSSWHGVTSIVMGNCGVGFAPARPAHHDFLIKLLEGVEDIPGPALAEGLSWAWETFPDYLDALERLPHAIDIGAQVPHAALRAYVMGERGADPDEPPTPDELAQMSQLVAEAVEAGAVGVATSRTINHRTSDGHTLGTLRADAAELLALVEPLRAADSGVVQLISDSFWVDDPELTRRELDLIELLAVRSGRPLSFNVVQIATAPDRWRELLARVDDLTARGHPVRAQVATRPIGSLLGLEASTTPFAPCRSYQEIAELPVDLRVAAMRDPDRRARIVAEFREFVARPVSGPPDFYQRLASRFGSVFTLGDPVDYFVRADESLGEQARQRGVDPIEVLYDALLELNGRRLLYYPGANFVRGTFDDLAAMIQHPNVLFGLSDAGAHCAMICDASMTTSTLTMWGRDRRDGPCLALEWLVHRYTQRNAAHVGWHDRGVVAPGFLADLNLIDPERLDCGHPRIVRDLPLGSPRLVQDAHGYRMTIKSGVVTFEDGVSTGELPGTVVRGRRSP